MSRKHETALTVSKFNLFHDTLQKLFQDLLHFEKSAQLIRLPTLHNIVFKGKTLGAFFHELRKNEFFAIKCPEID